MKRCRLVISPPRAFVLALALALCAMPAVMMSSLPGYFGLLFLLFLCAVSFVYGLKVSCGIKCSGLSGEESCRRGECVSLPLCITNSSRLVCVSGEVVFYTADIFGGIRTDESLCITLSPGETRRLGYDVVFDHVGEYKTGLRHIRTEGLLGVVSFVREYSLAETVKVLPLCHELDRLSLSDMIHSESIYSNRVSNADSIDYSGVREYSVGDPMKLIHWNLSSHTASYMTKLTESYGNSSLTIIPCTLTPEYDTETMMAAYDCVAECCLSVGEFANGQSIDTELLCEDGAGVASHYTFQSAGGFSEILMTVLPLPKASRDCEQLERLLKQELTRRYSASNIAVCTSKLSDYAAKQIMELKRRRKNVVLFYAQPYSAKGGESAEKALKTLRAADIEFYIAVSADEIGRSSEK